MLLGGQAVEVTNCPGTAAGGLEEVMAAPTTPTGKCDGVPRCWTAVEEVSVSEVLGRIFLGGVPVLGPPPAAVLSLNRL